MTLRVVVSTPDGDAVDCEADHVVVVSEEGEMAIYPRHVPIVALLKPGVARFVLGETTQRWALSEGVVEFADGTATIVVTTPKAL